jgi:hypothetical protein
MSSPTYSLALYDHQTPEWSVDLAQQLVGQYLSLNRQQLAQAFRTLLSLGWDEVSVYVQRDNPDTLEERQAEFREWAESVRDPAEQAAEGTRTLWARNGRAFAEYQIAVLDIIHAIRTRFEYVGFMGHGCPWMEKKDREECIATFLEQGNRFFEHEPSDASQLHKDARKDMLEQLTPTGLFGFIEPSAYEG